MQLRGCGNMKFRVRKRDVVLRVEVRRSRNHADRRSVFPVVIIHIITYASILAKELKANGITGERNST